MHLHRSFDDGWSPSSTKRQSSASTSWAWIILSLLSQPLGTGLADGGQPAFGWWRGALVATTVSGLCRCAAPRASAGRPQRRRSAKAVFGCPPELFFRPELEESVRRRTSLRRRTTEERASGRKALANLESRLETGSVSAPSVCIVCANKLTDCANKHAIAQHYQRSAQRLAATTALASSARRSSHRPTTLSGAYASDPSASALTALVSAAQEN